MAGTALKLVFQASGGGEEKKRVLRCEEALAQLPLPAFVDREAWLAFVEMRREKGKRAPLTERAARMVLKRLGQFHAEGIDPNEALERSARNGWSDVWPGKPKHVQRTPACAAPEAAAASVQALTLPQGRRASPKPPEMSPQTRAMVDALKARLRAGKAGHR